MHKLGYIFNDISVSKAVKLQEPFVISFSKSEATKNLSDIANSLLNNKEAIPVSSSGIKMFINKLTTMFNNA
jgi:flagellar biosynthesis protein FlhG